MRTQDYEGKHLDKDLLFPGNREYSPKTCLFVTRKVNNFVRVGCCPTNLSQRGLIIEKGPGRFYVRGIDILSGDKLHLGVFSTREIAEGVWLEHKRQSAIALAEIETDPLVANALRTKWT